LNKNNFSEILAYGVYPFKWLLEFAEATDFYSWPEEYKFYTFQEFHNWLDEAHPGWTSPGKSLVWSNNGKVRKVLSGMVKIA
jgi:hypothetical protein